SPSGDRAGRARAGRVRLSGRLAPLPATAPAPRALPGRAARPAFLQLAHPDIAEADLGVVVLQVDRGAAVWCVRRRTAVFGGAGDDRVVLDQNAVVQHGDARGRKQSSAFGEARRLPDDVIDLPLARRARGVHQRDRLLVDRGRLAIGIGGVAVTVEHLQFVALLQEDAAVAAVLAIEAIGRGRTAPFDVQLDVAELLAGADALAARH